VFDSGASCRTLTNSAMRNRPCSVTVNGPAGQVSQTKYTYNAGGHPTQTSTLISGSTYVTSNASYNANGTIASFTDVNPQATTNYYYSGTGGCNNLLLTSTTFPVNSLSNSQAWDCNGGVITSSSDANNQPTTYRYDDPLWRVTSMTDPLQNVMSYTYTTNTVDTRMLFNGNASGEDKVET